MFDATNGDILATLLIAFTLCATSPSILTLKHQLITRCANFVPGGTEADVLFYWNHWLIRLVIVSTGLAVTLALWGLFTGMDTKLHIDLMMAGVFSLALGYIGWAKWRQWRQSRHPQDTR